MIAHIVRTLFLLRIYRLAGHLLIERETLPEEDLIPLPLVIDAATAEH